MGAKYGQHFLVNSHAAERIVASMGLGAEDSVLEIGPGKGALTAFLLKAHYLAIVEIDPDMVALLQGRFKSFPQVNLFQADILRFDFSRLNGSISGPSSTRQPIGREDGTKKPFKVVGNLPYNLTSPILRRLSDWKGWETATLMVQKEVAERLCAAPATSAYGALTVGMGLTCQIGFVFELSEKSFSPPPKVKSAVVKLIRRASPLTSDIEGTQRVIQAAFQQRRKTILNSLSHGLGLEKGQVEIFLKGLGIDPLIRPERLPIQAFVQLNEVLSKNGIP
ncbi:MAG: Ribosomal RNA small subunit methyltransferase A [Elusimicrobia bacterium]|nr:Ribosomal RNA small subunit methyltransferase A [Elusimicrobiota bacterium]